MNRELENNTSQRKQRKLIIAIIEANTAAQAKKMWRSIDYEAANLQENKR